MLFEHFIEFLWLVWTFYFWNFSANQQLHARCKWGIRQARILRGGRGAAFDVEAPNFLCSRSQIVYTLWRDSECVVSSLPPPFTKILDPHPTEI